jgi:AraC-like DNA-binding protein
MSPSESEATLRRYHGTHAAHVHDHAQLLFGLHGCLLLELDGRLQRVEPGVGLVVPAGVAHAFEASGATRVWVVDTPDDAPWRQVRRFALPPAWRPDADTGAQLSLAQRAPRLRAPRSLDPSRLAQAVTGCLHQAWPNERLAALYALSVPRFHARWRALTGMSPQAWLRQQRLDLAEQLLRRGLALEAVALQVGYASAGALALALRRERSVGARRLRCAASRCTPTTASR